jgi:PAS domain S-box-containing protein
MTEMKKPKNQQEKNTTKKLPNQLIKDISNAEAIINAIGDGISILDRNFKILNENQAHRDMMGNHVGEFCYEAYTKGQGICGGCPVALTFKDGKVHTVEREKQTENKTKYMQITASPLKNSEGKIIAGIRVVRDITERQLLEEEIRERQGKYRSLYQEFRGILDAIPDALVLLSSDLKVIWSNEVAAKNMNMSLEDFIGQHCYKVRHGRSEPCEMCPVLVCFTSHKPKIIESTTPDGRIWELHVYPVFGDRGEVKGVIEAAHNITDRKRAEEALRESEAKYRTLVENIPQKIFTKDRRSAYISCNENYANDFGITPEEITGKTDFDFFPKELAEKYRFDDKRVMDTEKTEGIEEQYIQNNEKAWIYTVKTPIRDKDGNIEGIMGVFSDITERKQAEQEKKKLEEQLLHAQKMEAVGQLAGGIAHDFNNLLTAIIGYGHLLKNEMSKEDRTSSYVGQILSAAERAAILTNDLLTFSRKQIVNLQPVNLNNIIKNMGNLLLRVIGEDIELCTVLTDTDLTIMADSTQIDQILMNFATNSQDAMPKGGSFIITTDRVEINDEYVRTYCYGKPGSYALLSVEDTGTGMDETTKERIFEPFFTTKELGKGTGLGLSMVYGIVQQHDGYINVYSEPGKGTTFKILLPLIRPEVDKLNPGDFKKIKGGTETILIGEDDPQVRKLLKEVLSKAGYHIREAVDGEDAVKVFNKNKDNIHLLILDVIMPKKNGKEVYAEIKKVKSDVKAIFVSGYSADIINKKSMLEVGMNFISKPILPDELLIKVRNVLDNETRTTTQI